METLWQSLKETFMATLDICNEHEQIKHRDRMKGVTGCDKHVEMYYPSIQPHNCVKGLLNTDCSAHLLCCLSILIVYE